AGARARRGGEGPRQPAPAALIRDPGVGRDLAPRAARVRRSAAGPAPVEPPCPTPRRPPTG
ncbi:MAG: regulator, partial [bacterium]